MKFWEMAFSNRWVTADELKSAVRTEKNPSGEITKEKYEQITGVQFDETMELSHSLQFLDEIVQ